jgi:hypothetical protein
MAACEANEKDDTKRKNVDRIPLIRQSLNNFRSHVIKSATQIMELAITDYNLAIMRL